MKPQLGILGAGASGLSLALLSDLDYLVLEAEPHPGGHASATSIRGWTFDHGPHIMFSRDELLLECMLGSLGPNVHRCRRKNRVSLAGGLARYPVENDLAALPLPLRADALLSFLHARRSGGTPGNLAEWFSANFGDVLTSAYFRPYNEKLWKIPLERLSMGWADRIPRPPEEDVIRGALGELSEGYLHQLFYSYPLHGGYGALMDAWAAGIPKERLVLGTRVTRVVPGPGGVVVEAGGGVRRFGQVVSTLPLGFLIKIVEGVPLSVAEAVSRLMVNPVIAVTLGFHGEDPNQFTAVYIPDDDYLPNRVSYPAVFSPHNAPPGCFSVQAEITALPGAEVLEWSDDALVSHVLAGLLARSLVPADAELIFRSIERFPQGYVVYTEGYEGDLEIACGWFEAQGIILHGRFGRHQYLNVDGCLSQSIDLARELGFELADDEILARFRRLAGLSPSAP